VKGVSPRSRDESREPAQLNSTLQSVIRVLNWGHTDSPCQSHLISLVSVQLYVSWSETHGCTMRHASQPSLPPRFFGARSRVFKWRRVSPMRSHRRLKNIFGLNLFFVRREFYENHLPKRALFQVLDDDVLVEERVASGVAA